MSDSSDRVERYEDNAALEVKRDLLTRFYTWSRSMNRCIVVLACLAATWAPEPASAQSERAIQLALWSPVQIFPEEDAIRGVRLSLLYGSNASVTGFDLGLVSRTTGDFVGVQFGAVGLSDAGFVGWQNTWVNVVRGDFEGFQSGAVNVAEAGRGFQFAAVNHSRSFNGLQIAVVNYAGRLDGIQIGLVNIIREGGQFPIFPIVNWSR